MVGDWEMLLGNFEEKNKGKGEKGKGKGKRKREKERGKGKRKRERERKRKEKRGNPANSFNPFRWIQMNIARCIAR